MEEQLLQGVVNTLHAGAFDADGLETEH